MEIMLNNLLPDHHLPAIAIHGIQYDSRKVKPGDLFFATTGVQVDGRQFVKDVSAIAAAVLCEAPYKAAFANDFEIEDLSAQKGEVASRFYGSPSEYLDVIAVTGTNGKTSVSHYVAQAFGLVGQSCGVIGTLGAGIDGNLEDIGMTTPDAVDLQRMLSELREKGAEVVCLEASSHGLEQGRLNGTRVSLAIFTNISRDHLDYHENFAAYAAAKKKLFNWPKLKKTVLNLDDEFGEILSKELQTEIAVSDELSVSQRQVTCMTYSLHRNDADIHCSSINYDRTGINATVVCGTEERALRSSLFGGFNLSNLLAVVASLLSYDVDFSEAIDVVSQLKNVKGRMDVLSESGRPTVVIDYAHTPDALESVLTALKQHANSKIICVMGCGGDRDKGKRPLMGEVCGRLADQTVVTSDNPRNESPDEIVAQILLGFSPEAQVLIEVDRASAITLALSIAGTEDLVLIAGKGHEEYQDVNGRKIQFSDYAVVENYLSGN